MGTGHPVSALYQYLTNPNSKVIGVNQAIGTSHRMRSTNMRPRQGFHSYWD